MARLRLSGLTRDEMAARLMDIRRGGDAQRKLRLLAAWVALGGDIRDFDRDVIAEIRRLYPAVFAPEKPQ